jgi:hypothetical protein
MKRKPIPFIVVSPSFDGRDRWCIGIGNTIHHAWYMPRWLSFGRYWSTVKL